MEKEVKMVSAKSGNTVRTLSLPLPSLLLRVESFTGLLAALVLYGKAEGNWWVFFLLLLAPDLAMVGYMVNTRVGSIVYNAVHIYTWPILLAVVAIFAGSLPALHVALIWFAHISMDRTVGYGLKYPTAFKDTHLQRV